MALSRTSEDCVDVTRPGRLVAVSLFNCSRSKWRTAKQAPVSVPVEVPVTPPLRRGQLAMLAQGEKSRASMYFERRRPALVMTATKRSTSLVLWQKKYGEIWSTRGTQSTRRRWLWHGSLAERPEMSSECTLLWKLGSLDEVREQIRDCSGNPARFRSSLNGKGRGNHFRDP
jgi:hypothetical protein